MLISKDRGFYRELFKLSLPIALSSLVTFSISLSNNMMIARLGNEASSAVYLSNQISFLITMLLAGIEGAVLVSASHSIGAGENENARKIASVGLISAFLVASFFFVFSSFTPRFSLSLLTNNEALIEGGKDFLIPLGISFLFFAPSQAMAAALRTVKKPKIAFFAAISALAVNVSLNFVLIFGRFGIKALGIRGAGISTLAARTVEFFILFIYTFFIDRELNIRLSSLFKIGKDSFKRFFKTGTPLILTQLVWSINIFFASALMGRNESFVVAGLSAAIALYNLSYVVTNGMSGALGIIVGRTVGSGEPKALERLLSSHRKNIELIFAFLGILTAVFIQILKAPFISFWGVKDEALFFARGFINVLSVMVIGTAYQSASLNGFIKSIGDVLFVLKTESFFVFCVIIPASLLAANLGASPFLVFAILKCDQILKCPVAFLKLKKLYKKEPI